MGVGEEVGGDVGDGYGGVIQGGRLCGYDHPMGAKTTGKQRVRSS